MWNKFDVRKSSNILVFSISLISLMLFFFIIWNRLALPFVFEWGESAGLNQIYQILDGRPLYSQPSLEFSPLVYTPLYYFLAAGGSKIIGNALLSARLISLISCIASVFLIGWLIWRETKNSLLAWISGMIYLACFALADGFYDLARVDSLYIFAILMAFLTVRNAKSWAGYLVFGVLLVFGFYIKQSFLIVFLPLQFYLLLKGRKLAWIAIAVEFFGISIPLFLVNRLTDNWLNYYLFQLPKEHGYSFVSIINFWVGDTIRPLGILFGLSLFFLLRSKMESGIINSNSGSISAVRNNTLEKGSRDAWWIYFLFFSGSVAAAWITRSSNGGGANNCMPIYAVLAISSGLGAGSILKTKWVEENPWAYGFTMLVISIQFIGLIYNPFNFLPTKAEISLNDELENEIVNSNLPVLIPFRSHLTWELKQKPQIHIVNLFELTGYFKGDVQPAGTHLVNQIRLDICHQKYGFIVFDQPLPWFDDQLEIAYFQEFSSGLDRTLTSDLLSWQSEDGGVFSILSDYDIDQCLNTISHNNGN